MTKWLFLIVCLCGTALPMRCQTTPPLQAPGHVLLDFKVLEQREFRLGELIPFSYSYRSTTPDRYIYTSQIKELEGGRNLEISCSPAVERARREPEADKESLLFKKMLAGMCQGVGGGVGGGCGDCDWERMLSADPIRFGPAPLNMELRFRSPGTYSCVASAAEITTAPRTEKLRPALLVKSDPVTITIVADPVWSRMATPTYADAFRKRCRGNDVANNRFLECSDLARRITYLDTVDSLAVEVQLYDGRNHGWDPGFWEAIQGSSYRKDALRQMTNRMQDPDFQVSDGLVELLAFWDFRGENPSAFQSSDHAGSYHSAAIEKLRKFARLLGSSLEGKESDVVPESVKAYERVSERPICDADSPGETLIPPEERDAAVAFYKNRFQRK